MPGGSTGPALCSCRRSAAPHPTPLPLPPLLQAATAQNTLEPLRAPADKAKDEDMEEERKCLVEALCRLGCCCPAAAAPQVSVAAPCLPSL